MRTSYLRAVGEVLAVVSVVGSLIFVGLQLRQSTIASRAAAYQQLGVATASVWFQVAANRDLSDAAMRVDARPEELSSLSDSDRDLVKSFVVGILRLYETVYLQVEQGLLDPDAMHSLGWEGFGKSNILKATWPEVKDKVDASFARYLEESAALPK